jgi:hypothetical protein
MIKCLPFKTPFINANLTLIKTSSQSRHILAVNISPINKLQLTQAAETKNPEQLASASPRRGAYKCHFTVYGLHSSHTI